MHLFSCFRLAERPPPPPQASILVSTSLQDHCTTNACEKKSSGRSDAPPPCVPPKDVTLAGLENWLNEQPRAVSALVLSVGGAPTCLINSLFGAVFGINNQQEYLRFLHALDVLSPGLLSTIDDLLGMSTSSTLPAAKVCHTMTASFKLDLSLTPLTIQGSSQGPHGQKTCVVIDHHLRGHEAQLQHRLLSDHMLLTHADMMVTLCDLTGQVLRQNAAAQAYAGCLQDPIVPGMESLVVQTLLCAQAVVPRPPTSQAAMGPAAALAYAAAANCSRAPRSHNVLQLLLRHEPSLLHDLLEEVLVGHTWEGVVRVPASLISASHLPATDLPATGTSLIAQTKEHTVTSCDLSPHPCPANQSADKPVCSESINNTEVPLAPDMEQPNKSRRKLSRTTSFYVAQHRAPKSSSIQPPLAPTPEAVTTQSLSPSQAVTDSTAVKVLGQGLSRSQSNSPAKPLVVPNGLDKLRGPCSQPLTPGWHMASPQPAVTPTHVQLRSQAHPYSSTPGSAPPQVISGAHGLAAPHSASTAGQPSSAPWSMAQPYASHPPGPKGLDFSLASRELVSGPGRQPLTLFDRQASPKLHKLMKAESSVLSSFERQATDPCLACPPHPQSDPTPLRLCCADTTTDGRGRSKLALGHPTARTGKHSPPTGHSGKTDSSPEAVQRQRGSPEAAWHSPPPAHPGPTFPAASSQPSYAQQLQMDEGVTDNTFTLSAASPEPVAPITGFPSQTTSVHPSRPGYMSSIGADPAAAGPESSAPSGSARTLSLLRLHSRTAGQRPPPRSTSRSFMLSGASSLSPLTHPASSGTSPRLSMLLNPCKSSEQQTSAGSGVFSTVQRQPTSGTDNLLQSSQCQTPTHQPTGSVLETSSSTSFSGPKHRSLPSDQLCWHSIKATPVYDPVSGHQVLVLAQKDVTHQVEAEARLTQVMEASLGLLELIFPRHVIEHMTLGQASRPEKPISGSNAVGPKIDFDSLASHHDCVTILFTDICGFTAMSKEVEAVQVMNFLNTLYSAYDHLVDKHGVYKLETVGDCYVVVGGLMQKDAEGFVAVNRQSIDREAHAMAVLDFALDMMSMASTVVMPHNQQPVVVRCGIHSGPIVSGVVGHRMPKFCCFGDTMNVASRMESTCAKGGIQVSSDTYALLAKHPRVGQLSHSGGVEVKGKGRMGTYLFDFNKASDIAVPVHQLPPSTGAPTKVDGHQNHGPSGPEAVTLDISSSLTFALDGNSSQALPTPSQFCLLSGSRSPPPSLSDDKALPGPLASPRGAALTASKGAACEGSSCQPWNLSPYSAVRGSSVRTFAEVMQGMLQANCPGTPASGCNKDRTPAPSRPVLRPRPITINALAPMTSPQPPPSTASARPSSLPSDHELHLRNQPHEASAVPSHLTTLNNMDITATTSSQLSGLSGATAMHLSAASLSATATSGAAGVARLGAPSARLDVQRCQLTTLFQPQPQLLCAPCEFAPVRVSLVNPREMNQAMGGW